MNLLSMSNFRILHDPYPCFDWLSQTSAGVQASDIGGYLLVGLR